MPYANTVTLLDIEGGTLTANVSARLWMLSGTNQDERARDDISVSRGGVQAEAFNFVPDANYADVSRDVGLSIQDTVRVPDNTGWLFRSGNFQGDLPADPIEIITANHRILPADLPGLLPSVPYQVDSATITGMVAVLADASTAPVMPAGIDFTATGRASVGANPLGFTYTGRLVLTPSAFVGHGHMEALTVTILNPAVAFTPTTSGGSDPFTTANEVVGSIALDAIADVLHHNIKHEFGPAIRTKVEYRINTSVAAEVGRVLPGGVLPDGVYLSIRSISTSSTAVAVRGAVGAFGGVIAKLPPLTGGGGGGGSPLRCSYTSLALAGFALNGFSLLRRLRDTRLSRSDSGRRLIELYYTCGPEVIALLRADRALAARAATAANELTGLLKRDQPIPPATRRRYEGMLRELSALGSAELRAAVDYTLGADAWRLLYG